MFSLIRFLITVFLLIGVVYLGIQIYDKSNEISPEVTKKKEILKDKISELKEDAKKQKRRAEVAIKSAREKLSLDNERIKKKVDRKGPPKIEVRDNTKKKAKEPVKKIEIDPIDDEDRILTAELLNKINMEDETDGDNKNKQSEQKEPFKIDKYFQEEEPEEPVDIERLAELRNLYMKTVEILDFE